MGFNILSLAYGNHVNSRSADLSNMMYRYTASLDPVPRGQVRCEDPFHPECVEFALGGEILQRFTDIELEDKPKFYSSNFFVGVGTSLSSSLLDGYLELG